MNRREVFVLVAPLRVSKKLYYHIECKASSEIWLETLASPHPHWMSLISFLKPCIYGYVLEKHVQEPHNHIIHMWCLSKPFFVILQITHIFQSNRILREKLKKGNMPELQAPLQIYSPLTRLCDWILSFLGWELSESWGHHCIKLKIAKLCLRFKCQYQNSNDHSNNLWYS